MTMTRIQALNLISCIRDDCSDLAGGANSWGAEGWTAMADAAEEVRRYMASNKIKKKRGGKRRRARRKNVSKNI